MFAAVGLTECYLYIASQMKDGVIQHRCNQYPRRLHVIQGRRGVGSSLVTKHVLFLYWSATRP